MSDLDFLSPERRQRLSEVASRRQLDVTVVSENIHDLHNVSAIMRTADAFGVGTIDVIGQSEGFLGHPKTSSSARLWVEVRTHDSTPDCFSRLKEDKKRIFVTRLDPQARSIFEVDWTKPCAIVLGNEHSGVSDKAAALGDESIFIPMAGMVQSFNVSVAAAIILTELYRQRSVAGMYQPDLTPQRQALLAFWLDREAQRHGLVS